MSSSGATEYKYWFEGLMPKQHEAVVNFLGVQMQLQQWHGGVFASWIVCFALIALAVLGRMGLNSVSSKEGV